jgi:hypothetical protein
VIINTLYDLIQYSAGRGLTLQKEDGSLPAGHNGPYFDTETPVRNTGHWLITFLKVYEITKDTRFLNAALKAVNYLLSEEARPAKAAFWHRKNPEKDFSNGLIGQAWSIEALCIAAQYFDHPDIINSARDVFLMHSFDEKPGLWHKIELDGTPSPVDRTFNHQLWFAAAGSLLNQRSPDDTIARRLNIFMDNLTANLNLYPWGLIVHSLKSSNKMQIKKKLLEMISRPPQDEIIFKAVGYHQFNLYAFALLKGFFPLHSFWENNKFKALWEYANTQEYEEKLYKSEYGYPYNPPGFEMAYALEIFGNAMIDKCEKQEKWIARQIRLCFNFESSLMTKGTKDPQTHAARIYEAVRLPDLKINL